MKISCTHVKRDMGARGRSEKTCRRCEITTETSAREGATDLLVTRPLLSIQVCLERGKNIDAATESGMGFPASACTRAWCSLFPERNLRHGTQRWNLAGSETECLYASQKKRTTHFLEKEQVSIKRTHYRNHYFSFKHIKEQVSSALY